MIYLDNAATTKVSETVLETMLRVYREHDRNPSSSHAAGRDAAEVLRIAREQVANPIHAKPEQILFTSGATEANNLAILGLAEHLKKQGKTHIITSQVEHPSVLNPIKQLFYQQGFTVSYVPVYSDCSLDMISLRNAFQENTGLVSLMAVNNETGAIFPVSEVGRLCHERGVLFHTDCVQAYGKLYLDVKKDHIDFLSASAHKFHGPKGVGFLYAADRKLLSPLLFGGGQEKGLRSGTENVAGIAGMGAAAQEAFAMDRQHIVSLHTAFLKELRALCGATVILHKAKSGASPYVLSLRFPGVHGETLAALLSSKGVYVSSGSACSANHEAPSHVLKAMGLRREEAASTIRVSLSDKLSCEELVQAAKIIAESAKELRNLSK